MNSNISLLIFIFVIAIIILLITRDIALWYFKINKRLQALERIEIILKQISQNLAK